MFEGRGNAQLTREFERMFTQSNTQDVGFLLAAPHEIDLPKGINQLVEAKLAVVMGKEAAVTLKGRKNYRVAVRDTFSQPVVKEFFAP